jgi:hypothetical protein
MSITLANVSAAASAKIQAVTPDDDPDDAALLDTTRNLMAASQIRKKLDAFLSGFNQPTASDVSKVKSLTTALSDASNAIAGKEANLSGITTHG